MSLGIGFNVKPKYFYDHDASVPCIFILNFFSDFGTSLVISISEKRNSESKENVQMKVAQIAIAEFRKIDQKL